MRSSWHRSRPCDVRGFCTGLGLPSGSTAFRIHGLPDPWPSGSMAFRIHDRTGSRVDEEGEGHPIPLIPYECSSLGISIGSFVNLLMADGTDGAIPATYAREREREKTWDMDYDPLTARSNQMPPNTSSEDSAPMVTLCHKIVDESLEPPKSMAKAWKEGRIKLCPIEESLMSVHSPKVPDHDFFEKVNSW
ncbi:unnamed protein product [Darwinula stevensoni]|uniref:Uncharacterized protein n=1 Tax=Darwinula stevensoni TaxID=69355 RepID=A0A7R9FPV1_9CRUS|nr:unnamed protein product [Darwinula stevensoni]CAG0898570.1 unnamed protein product [Darwinula stevensoni]